VAHAQAAVVIGKPALDIFNFLADGTNNTKWRSDIVSVKQLTPGPIGLGTQFSQIRKGPMNRDLKADYEITVFEPGQIIGFRVIAGHPRPEGRFMFGGEGNETSVQFDLQLPPKSFLQQFMDKKMQKTLELEVQSIHNLSSALGGPPVQTNDGQ
jgi:uncharacterized membrane protein